MSDSNLTYERTLASLAGLPQAASEAERSILWIDPRDTVGLARNEQARVELFLKGTALVCRSSLVEAAIDHKVWEIRSGGTLMASRLIFPAEPYFDAVAAFLCTHLLDSGYPSNPQVAFTRSEPLIELALDATRLSSSSYLGLVGELLCLAAMVRARPERTRELIDAWEGHARATRDFQLDSVGLEVKTTTGLESTHHVAGLRQVEVGNGNGSVAETDYYLMSLGVERVPAEEDDGHQATLPGLVDGVLTLIDENLAGQAAHAGSRQDFVYKVREYGAALGAGYDHESMRDRVFYQQPWRQTFARCYDMKDPRISLPKTEDLRGFVHLDLGSLSFMITLPAQVHGDLNPRLGLTDPLIRLLNRAWPKAVTGQD